MSVVHAFENSHCPLMLTIKKDIFHSLYHKGHIHRASWIPQHVSITGNEAADAATCNAIVNSTCMFKGIPSSVLATHLGRSILSSWQSDWDTAQTKTPRDKDHCSKTAIFHLTHMKGRSANLTPTHRAYTDDTWVPIHSLPTTIMSALWCPPEFGWTGSSGKQLPLIPPSFWPLNLYQS
jgi:hypothetical protein